jgi:hypothetical protein
MPPNNQSPSSGGIAAGGGTQVKNYFFKYKNTKNE